MATRPRFKFWSFFFSLRGRVSRGAYSWFEIPALAFLLLIGQVAVPAIMMAMATSANTDPGLISLVTSLAAVANFFLLWPRFAILVKRLHDVNLPWYWATPLLLPIATSPLAYIDAIRVAQNGFQPTAVTYALGGMNIALFWINLAFVVAFCFIPPRQPDNRFGSDPRQAAPANVF